MLYFIGGVERLTPPWTLEFSRGALGCGSPCLKTNVVLLNVESWPLLGQVQGCRVVAYLAHNLKTTRWLGRRGYYRGVERLTPPGPWDFLEALWDVAFLSPRPTLFLVNAKSWPVPVKCGGCRGIACRSCPECNVLVPMGFPWHVVTRNLDRSRSSRWL